MLFYHLRSRGKTITLNKMQQLSLLITSTEQTTFLDTLLLLLYLKQSKLSVLLSSEYALPIVLQSLVEDHGASLGHKWKISMIKPGPIPCKIILVHILLQAA